MAKSISSTFSFLIAFLTHPPTYRISLLSEKSFIASKILFTGVVEEISFIFLCYRKLVLGRSQAVRHGFLVPAS